MGLDEVAFPGVFFFYSFHFACVQASCPCPGIVHPAGREPLYSLPLSGYLYIESDAEQQIGEKGFFFGFVACADSDVYGEGKAQEREVCR